MKINTQTLHVTDYNVLFFVYTVCPVAFRKNEDSSQRKANTDKAQILDDEMFTLYLQNKEFLNDLREYEDLMRTLEKGDHCKATTN